MEFVNDILAICGGISIIGGAAAVIWKWLHPAVALKEKVETLEQHAKNDYENIQEIRRMEGAICTTLIALIDHELTGNHVDGLKKAKQELVKTIVEKSP